MFSKIDPGKTSGIFDIFLKVFVLENELKPKVNNEQVIQKMCRDQKNKGEIRKFKILRGKKSRQGAVKKLRFGILLEVSNYLNALKKIFDEEISRQK